MRIYKYIHFCSLIEHNGEELLFDPGKFSFVDGRFKPDVFGDVSTVVITHSHPNHIAVKILKRILALSGACAMANAEFASRVQEEGIGVILLEDGTHRRSKFTLQAIPAQHEPILSDSLPLIPLF
jgi:L-ascorbate metabolism protein UlaG (beta-lactamase superfamily)